MAQCKGCGAMLQDTDEQAPGYTPKIGAMLCRRCFRIQHYDDVTVSYQTKMDNHAILQEIQKRPGLILWTADLFDWEANRIDGLVRHCAGRDIVLVATKRDLLPDTVSQAKLTAFLYDRLQEWGINVKGLVVTGAHGYDGIEGVKEAIRRYATDHQVVVMGAANAGKSTVLHALLKDTSHLTMSRNPGTTLGFTRLEWEDCVLYDSPGLHRYDSMIFQLDEKQLKTVIPDRTIKPRIYQCKGSPSFALGGLARLDLWQADGASCVIYASERLPIHRGKAERADELWEAHWGELLQPTIGNRIAMRRIAISKREQAIDICIHGLGWICVKGTVRKIELYLPETCQYTIRKAMI